jgi:acyl-CoA thioesterase
MRTPFSTLMKNVQKENEFLTLHIPEDWLQGRTVFGGLQAAFALRAMREWVPQLPLRALQATFLAPVAAGKISARAQKHQDSHK